MCVSLQPATTCGDRFPIQRYVVEVIGFPALTQTHQVGDEQQSAPQTVRFAIGSQIQQGQIYFLRVNACISATCRPSNLFQVCKLSTLFLWSIFVP